MQIPLLREYIQNHEICRGGHICDINKLVGRVQDVKLLYKVHMSTPYLTRLPYKINKYLFFILFFSEPPGQRRTLEVQFL